VALWHERDISHSSVERVIIPDSTVLVDYMLDRLRGLLEGLLVYTEKMKRNMGLSFGLFNSQRVMLALVGKGMSREEAYAVVQKNAMASWRRKKPFIDILRKDPVIRKNLTMDELGKAFDLKPYLMHVDYVFERVFGKAGGRGRRAE
jgi:adenylosuccinate lyase